MGCMITTGARGYHAGVQAHGSWWNGAFIRVFPVYFPSCQCCISHWRGASTVMREGLGHEKTRNC